MPFVESLIPIGTSNLLSRWASFGLDLEILVVAAARALPPSAQIDALHIFGGDLPWLASTLFVESLIPR